MVRSLALSLASVLGWVGCCNSMSPADREAQELAASEGSLLEAIHRPQRCQPIGRDEVIGPKSTNDTNLDRVLPFATEVGEGVAFDHGFAVGALRQEGPGTSFVVVTSNRDATDWRTLSIGESHGDAEAPRVFARGGLLGVALLEPTGASRTLRLARVDRDNVHWGAELLQGHDESLAFDVALGPTNGVAVWDDVPKGRKVSAIVLATFNPSTLKNPSKPNVITAKQTDAELPRVIERPGGFWLFWLARRPAANPDGRSDDTRYRAEGIDHRWIEAVPLDQAGGVTGTPVRIGPTDGHVLAYGAASVDDGSAVVVWRDDDTPSGSVGGHLYRVRVRPGGVDEPERIDEPIAGIGAPKVMPGWFAIADTSGTTRMVPMGADGTFSDKLAQEDVFGAGEPIANHGNDILVSRPDGTAARLFVVRCVRDVFDGGVGEADDQEGLL